MNRKGKKLEPKLRLDMSFDEALSRFVATKPDEVEESIRRAKGKKPPGSDPPRRPAPTGRKRKPA
jgi:hypothetical protein